MHLTPPQLAIDFARWPLLAVAFVAFAAPSSAHAAQDPVRSIEVDQQNVDSRVRLVDSDVRNAITKSRQYPIQRRFVEATIAYSRGNWNLATVQLMDLVYNTKFQSNRQDYYNSLYMLGDSLYRMRNYKAAQKYLNLIIRRPGGKHFQNALQSLVDIAIRLHSFDLVSQYASHLSSIPPGQRRTELIYQFGRSFFAARKFVRAKRFLGQIPVGTKRWGQARFYLGALLVSENKVEEAVREFRDVVSAGKMRDEERRPAQTVLDYCNLALGRIYLARKKFDDAVFHYQSVDRNSPVYEEALFEMAATHVANKQSKKALEALDILLLTVSDDRVRVEAAVLRGRINLMSKEYDNADASYKEVVEQYSAISGEMERFAKSTARLEQFFSWLLNRSSDDYSVVRPVSKRVARYIEKDEDMARVVQLFDEMATEKRDVKISEQIATTIDAALGRGNNRLDMYPSLKDNWLKLVEAENTVVRIGERVVDLLRKYAEPVLSPAEKLKANKLRAERRSFLGAFSKIPATARAYSVRKNRVAAAFNNLAAATSLLKSNLGSVRDQILAIEKMLNDRVYGAKGIQLSKEREAEVRGALQQEKDELRRTFRLVDELSQLVEVAANRVGAGDNVSANEARTRGALLARQRAEQQLYAQALTRTSTRTGDAGRLATVRGRLDQTLLHISQLYRKVNDQAEGRTAKIRTQLDKEKRNIANYKVAVNQYEEESRHLARTVGYSLIRKAQSRLSDIVLEADLGLVDVAWQRKQDKAREIRGLQDERGGRVKSLQGVLNNLSDDADVEGEE